MNRDWKAIGEEALAKIDKCYEQVVEQTARVAMEAVHTGKADPESAEVTKMFTMLEGLRIMHVVLTKGMVAARMSMESLKQQLDTARKAEVESSASVAPELEATVNDIINRLRKE